MQKNKKKADCKKPVWEKKDVHVWRSKVGDLTFINLRDVTENLDSPVTFEEAAYETKASVEQVVPEAVSVKVDTSSRPAEKKKTPPTKVAEAPQQKSCGFEFVWGVNIPNGETAATPVEEKKKDVSDANEMFALFHDPLWGGGFSTPPTTDSKPPSQPTTSINLAPQLPQQPNVVPSPMPYSTGMPTMPNMQSTTPAPTGFQVNAVQMQPQTYPVPYPMYNMPFPLMNSSPFNAQPQMINLGGGVPYYMHGGIPTIIHSGQPTISIGSMQQNMMPRTGTNIGAHPYTPGT
ncbi:hypothetical protein ADEAN_000538700 [Angomonas deanei]|uniref:Uncharacterized protein n=1 Tax=Angomonas deanei TaxID=59799 RepID=A0A7G2CG16_9TRYP|nr:hypothetical protein ADEAN_000538700 [Angomonas deanei]